MVTRRNDERTVAGRHRMMRRADREVTEPQQIDAIIATCKIVSLAYTDAEGITIVPLNFGYVFDAESNHLTLYFHGSATGRKMDAVKAANNALPMAFKSIVGNGTASIIDDLDEARQGLALLMKQQAGMEHAEFTDQQVRAVTVWKVEADYLTAKVREKPQLHTH
ncbi:pyridoxamine 5'-phosphate oxidase family protein [Bifidobacterium pseudocatenulatum]|uniref:pyridoxamine 5'-phosphate oxidase family protein n=1 Tax=Bifidobacterium pseudocatenulatum TaxID=28026 RepID=UPI001CFE2C26|nr:pyridoxamine 5'-phosphate oxidase family protein [Bifidobacterium pseudocatenulatum]MCB4885569.1 pyridoxamine 5'-phosphate oxidase family protein [Bifidobacterium pseudocatenulatum]